MTEKGRIIFWVIISWAFLGVVGFISGVIVGLHSLK